MAMRREHETCPGNGIRSSSARLHQWHPRTSINSIQSEARAVFMNKFLALILAMVLSSVAFALALSTALSGWDSTAAFAR